MHLRIMREENPVDGVIELLRSGNYRKAKIKLGQLRGKPDEFRRLFEYLTKGTGLEGARLDIKAVRAKVRCRSCDWHGDPEIKANDVKCPRCLKDVEILQGNEFQVTV